MQICLLKALGLITNITEDDLSLVYIKKNLSLFALSLVTAFEKTVVSALL